jgi:hypothetical protein
MALVVRRRAECTCLSPASYAASLPYRSADCFGVHLHARGRCGLRFGCAAQRSGTRCCPGRPRRRRAAAAPRRMRNGDCTRQRAAACTCTAGGGGDSARRTPPIRRKRKRRTRCRSGRSRRRRMRRAIGRFGDCRGTPPIAARCCQTCARRGRGAGVGPTGYPSTQPVPETQNSRLAPRVDCVWVTVNGREYSKRTRSTRHLAPRSRIHPTWQTLERSGNGDCGRRRRREIVSLGKLAGERTGHGTWRPDRHGGAPACDPEIGA